MDHAVALVQAYLQLNGYFTSAEYPVVASTGRNGFRTLTDIDMLAFRFPTGIPISLPTGLGLLPLEPSLELAEMPADDDDLADEPLPAGPATGAHATPLGLGAGDLDPGLAVPHDRIDLVIGEVKEGRVGINSGARDPEVLKAVISRFGQAADVDRLVGLLLASGMAMMPTGYQVRLIAFGAFPPGAPVPPCRIISLGHVLQYLQSYVRRHWAMLRHCQFKDPALGFLMTLEKARRGGAGRRGEGGVELVSADVERIARPRPNEPAPRRPVRRRP